MLKTMKYEFTKDRITIFIIIGLMAIFEAMFLYFNYFDFEYVVIPIIFLILMGVGAFFCILINGITMFGRDFSHKSGYLVYMTPQPAIQIMAAKIITTFITGVVFLVAYYLLGVLDFSLMIHQGKTQFSDTEMANMVAMFDSLISKETFASIGQCMVVMVVEIFSVLTIAYLAICIANTLLRGSKFSGIISFVLFVLISIVVTRCGNLFSAAEAWELYLGPEGLVINGFDILSKNGAFTICYNAVIGALAMFGASYLIEKKIDL